MSKKLSVLLVCTVALLSTLLIPAVLATPPEPASGTWTYTPTVREITKDADGNSFMYGEDSGTWTGTFEGTDVLDVFTAVTHKPSKKNPFGLATARGLIYFEGSVNGKSGTLLIQFEGKKAGDPLLWSGKWMILSGTGDLANLQGQGAFWGPSKNLEYSGWIHFDPS